MVVTQEEEIAIYNSEKALYTDVWKNEYVGIGEKSQVTQFVRATTCMEDNILDIGCGNGTVVKSLRANGRRATGIDITLGGIEGSTKGFVGCPVWALPFEDNTFDYTFSMDFMEHLPPNMVKRSVEEISRVTRRETFHAICTQESTIRPELHKSVHTIDWWRIMFKNCVQSHVYVNVIDTIEFPILYHYVCGRKIG